MATSADEFDNSTMFAAEISKEQEELLLCPVCQYRLEDPKDLGCQHSFCKTCLDAMLNFNADGSASIECPMRCNPPTVINKNQTTNDLKTSYTFKSILDWFDQQEKRSDSIEKQIICKGKVDCTNEISMYCRSCNLLLCQYCCTIHKHNSEGNTYMSVKFNRKTSTLMVMCKEHDTFASYVCCEKELICLYCKQRKHKEHRYEKVTTISDRIRNELATMKNENKHKYEENENIANSASNITENAINDIRQLLKVSLANRMIKGFAEYFSQMKTIEERYLNEFETFAENHMKVYSDNISNNPFNEFMERPNFGLAIEEQNIVISSAFKEFTVPSYNIALTKTTSNPSLPLGNLKIDFVEDIILKDVGTTKSSVTTTLSKTDDSDVTTDLIDDLDMLYTRAHNFIEERNDVENIGTTSGEEDNENEDPNITDSYGEAVIPTSCNESEIRHVKIIRSSNGQFGFSLRSTNSGFQVDSIENEQRCQDLREGDIIISINNKNIQNLQYSEVVEILRSCAINSITDFQVKTSVLQKSNQEPVTPSAPSLDNNPSQYRLLKIRRGRKGFGFTVEDSPYGPKVKFVRDDRRCQGLKIGDVIVSINNNNVQRKEFGEVIKILKGCPADKTSDFYIQR